MWWHSNSRMRVCYCLPRENIKLSTTQYVRVPLWKFRSLAQKFHMSLGQRKSEIRHNKESRRNHYTTPVLSAPSTSTQAVIFPTGENEGMWVSTQLPWVYGVLPKRLTCFFLHTQNNVMCCVTSGRQSAERTATRPLRGFQRDMKPTNSFVDYTGKTTHKLQETFHL